MKWRDTIIGRADKPSCVAVLRLWYGRGAARFGWSPEYIRPPSPVPKPQPLAFSPLLQPLAHSRCIRWITFFSYSVAHSLTESSRQSLLSPLSSQLPSFIRMDRVPLRLLAPYPSSRCQQERKRRHHIRAEMGKWMSSCELATRATRDFARSPPDEPQKLVAAK